MTVAREPSTQDPVVDPDARAAVGKARRQVAPRSSHADWTPAANRPDPVQILLDQAAGRVAELLPLRYGRMLVSAFSFYRGAAAIMACDLADTPSSGLDVQLCGDAHLSNFGTFSSPERELVFDITDFDETLRGPWEWDVKRLAASVCIAGRDRAFTRKQIGKAVLATVRAYREAINGFARQGNLEVWYSHLDVDAISDLLTKGVDVKRMQVLEKQLEGARRNTSVRALGKLTTTVDGTVRFLDKPPLLVPADDLSTGEAGEDGEEGDHSVQGLLDGYRESLPENRRTLLDGYHYASMARKVVGVGSVGMRVWMILLHGRDGADPLLLQAKEANASVLEPYLGRPPTDSHAARVVAGQHLMQATSDIFLGWDTTQAAGERYYYVRQAADGKGAIDVSLLVPRGLAAYGRLCGWTLARAHARAGDRIAISGYLGGGDAFDRAAAAFAERYADQNEADFKALQAAVSSGRVQATQEPAG
jgi:uncharacterized protein (DUF2252 family)